MAARLHGVAGARIAGVTERGSTELGLDRYLDEVLDTATGAGNERVLAQFEISPTSMAARGSLA